jgi:hypothetical protein
MRETLALVAVAIGLAGCSDDGAVVADARADHKVGDCTDPARACVAPFVCRAGPVPGEMVCLSPEGDVPTCSGTPPGQVVPFQPGPQGPVVHWVLSGCVATSYTSSLAVRAADIAAAVKAWDDVACSELCLEPPRVSEADPDLDRGERRLHFRSEKPLSSSPAVATVNFEPATGRIFTAVASIDPQQQGSLSKTDLMQLVGLGVGLATVPPGGSIESVMALGSAAKAPTAADRTAICKLYGRPSYCGD